MAIALAPRVYGLDAICAATLHTGGGEEAAHFARRVFEPRRRQGSGGGPGRPARRRRGLPARLRPPPPARRRQGPGVQPRPPPTMASRAATPSCRSSMTTCRSWSIRSPTSSIAARSPSICWPILCMAVRRDLDGDLSGIAAEAGERARPESMMHIEIDRQADPALLDELAAALDPRAGRGAAGGRGLAGDAARLPRRHRRSGARPLAQPAPSTRISCAGWRPTISPSSAIAATAMSTIRRSPAACATS